MNLRAISAFLLLSALCGCSARHSAISATYDFTRLKRIAVTGFSDGQVQLSGAEDMVTRALLEKGFSVVERSELDKIIKEQKISAQGYLSSDTARELGKIMGVDGFLMGRISSYTPEKEDVMMIEASSTRVDMGGGQPPQPQPGHRGGGGPGGHQPQSQPSVTTTIKRIPHVYTKYAQVGLTMRLVDTQTGEVAWAGSYTTEGVNGAAAAESAADYLVNAFYKDMRKQASKK